MRSSELLIRQASHALRTPRLQGSLSAPWIRSCHSFSTPTLQHRSLLLRVSTAPRCPRTPLSASIPSEPFLRRFHISRRRLEEKAPSLEKVESEKQVSKPQTEEELYQDEEEQGFTRSERANQASQVNLSARLSKEGKDGKSQSAWAGFTEVWRLVKIAKPEVKTLSVAFAFLLVSSGITMSLPFSIGKIIDIATKSDGSADMLFGLDITTFYFALGSVLAIGAAANYGRIIILRIVGERVVARLRTSLYKKTFVQNAEFFDANRIGDLISRLSSDTIIVGKSITQNMSDGLRSMVSGVAGLGLMAYVSVKLCSVLALCFPPIAIGAFFYGRMLRNLSRKIQRNLGTLTKIAEERLGNVRTSQAFAGEAQEVARYSVQTRKIFDLGKREAKLSALFYSSSGFAGNMTMLVILWFGGGMVQSGALTIGDLSTFLMYALYGGSSMFGLSSFYSELMKGVGAASRLFELQDREPTLSPTRGLPVPDARGTIRFENVSFAYPTRPAVPIFNNLSFSIPQGSNVAIVGPSGGGKSTIASLMLRFYTPTEGTITIAGTPLPSMNVKQLRRKIGLVAQEPVLFSGTIASNISYGKPRATRPEIVAAARKANCVFIGDFPDGLDTFVGPRGAQLSGGQKQRIAIARALIKNPDILILDEATSALDAESETLVNEALAKLLRGNNTTISIAHRLSTIKRSDTIIVLSPEGTVAEQGSYKELSERKDGAFTKLMEWQMSGGEIADGTGGNGPLVGSPQGEAGQAQQQQVIAGEESQRVGGSAGEGGPPSEQEEMVSEVASSSPEAEGQEENVRVRQGKQTGTEKVLEKISGSE